jgi:hypothetical protein
MDTDTSNQAQAIIRAVRQARAELHGSGNAKEREGRARSLFSAYTKASPFAPHVRDVYNVTGVQTTAAALDTLELILRAFLDESGRDARKLRPDVNEKAHRVMLEATGQAPKMVPPGERDEDEKDPVAVDRGKKGGGKGGQARAEALTQEELSGIAETAARARWRRTGAEKTNGS